MATGDQAAAAGMDLVPGSTPANQIDTELNKGRDYVAQFFAAAKTYADGLFGGISLAWTSITGKPSTFPPSTHTHSFIQSGGMAFGDSGSSSWYTSSPTIIDAAFYNPYGRANGVSSWLALGIGTDGRIGFQLSSRRFKKNIRSWSPDKQAILAMRLVEFQYKVAVADGNSEVDHGLIAEELHDLGLTWLVAYDEGGAPVTVKYDRIGLALLAVVQDHEERLVALEDR